MTGHNRLIDRILDASHEVNSGSDVFFTLGVLLSDELGAEDWALWLLDCTHDECRNHESRSRTIKELKVSTDEREAFIHAPGPLFVTEQELENRHAGQALLVIPFRLLKDPAGIYVLTYGKERLSSPLDTLSGGMVSKALTVTLTNHLLLAREPYQSRGLEILSTFSHRLAGILDSDQLLEGLKECLEGSLGASAGRIQIFDSHWAATGSPETTSFPQGGRYEMVFSNENKRLRSALKEGQALISGVKEQDLPPPPAGGVWNLITMPLQSRGTVLGMITLLLPEARTKDLPLCLPSPKLAWDFLSSLADEISLRLANVILHARADSLMEERQKRLQELWILQETNNALRGTVKLNRILKMILAAATTEMGLGFNRAALFLLNKKTGLLQGMMGVGPDSMEEADKIWKSLSRHSDLSLSSQIELHADNQPRQSLFDGQVKGIRIPVTSDGGTLSQCVKSLSTLSVTGTGLHPAPEPELVKRLGMTVFAATPIISRDQVFGVVAVDNVFDKKPITGEDIRLLSMFASQAGLAIANAKDHRAHKRAVEELRLARVQLVHTERLALLGEVAAGLAHEIRNPLVTIGGFARRLEKKLVGLDPNRKYAAIIAAEVQRLERFLEEILLFGNDRRPVMKPVALNQIVKETLRLFSGNFSEAGIEVLTSLDPELPLLSADEGQLRQIFINLYSNAADAMPDGGKLFLKSAPAPDDPGAISVSVSDTGGGVDAVVLSNIFNPFYTTKSGGHGLGLALSQRIVSDHSGRISVKNHPGRGLTFTITLPLSTSDIHSVPESLQRKNGREGA